MSEQFDLESELRELAESKELLKAVSDIDYSKHVVDGISEETGIAKWKVKLTYKALAPLIGCVAAGAGKLLADGMKQKMLSIAARFPWTGKVVKAIKDMTTKTTQEIQDAKAANEHLARYRPLNQEALKFRRNMSLEFNALLDTYENTRSLRTELSEFGVSLDAIREDLTTIEGFVNPQPRLKKSIERTQRNRFVYRSDFIPFVGRTAELEKLHNFLWSDALFCWQAITAPGGVGKSRLAWEFCQRCSVIWRAGFVDNLQAEKAALTSWQPTQPTLLVIDYASKDREEVKGILKTLAERADLDCAVRVLLLDRDSSDEWLKEGWPGSDGHAVEDCRYQEPWPLETTLGEDASKEILRFFLGSGQSVSDTELQGHLKTLEGIDPKKRPVFAAFYADAVAREGAGRKWDRESLVRDVIKREKDHYWQRNGVRFVTDKDEALLALATMMGGIRSTHTNMPPQVTSMAELIDHPERFEALGGYVETDENGETVQLIPPWEPDLVGELFVLDLLKDRRKTGTNPLRKPLAKASWSSLDTTVASFLERTTQDYPKDITLPILCLPPDKGLFQQALWCLLAVNLVSLFGKAGRLSCATQVYNSLKKIASLKPYHADAQADAAINLIRSNLKINKIAIAEEIYIDILSLATNHPADHRIAISQAKACLNFINTYGTHKDLKSASRHYRSVASLERKFSDHQTMRSLLIQSTTNIIRACCNCGDFASAQQAYDIIYTLYNAAPRIQGLPYAITISSGFLSGFNYMANLTDHARTFEETFRSLCQQFPGDPKVEELALFITQAKAHTSS